MTGPTIRYPILEQPSQVLRELRRQAPVVAVTLWNGRRGWLVTRHATARQALTDPRLSTDATNPEFPSLNPSQVVPNYRGGLLRMDDTRQRELRNLLASKFTARAARQWRTVSERIVAEQVTVLQRGGPPTDLVTGFALPVPLRFICRLLGVADRDVDYVRHHAQMSITRAYESSLPSVNELREFVAGLVRDSETTPRDHLIGQMVTDLLLPGAITREELVDLSLTLLVGGHTTTASGIGLSVLSLLEEPERYRALHDDPALVDPMVEELLRFLTIFGDGAARLAKHDLELGGVKIRAGDPVVVSVSSANRDDEVFADPDAIRPHRTNLRGHIAFGWGVHRCPGQHLARMELQVALAALTRAIPTLRLAVPVEQLRSGQREKHLSSVQELPVTW